MRSHQLWCRNCWALEWRLQPVRRVSYSQGLNKPARETRASRMTALLEEADPTQVLTLAMDCSLNRHYHMNTRELKHLAGQIKMSYGSIIRHTKPCRLHLVGLEPGGDIDAALKQAFLGYDSDHIPMKRWSQSLCEVFDKKDILYLSPYSSTALGEVDGSKVYVIGGVVDSVRHIKRLTEYAAEGLGVSTACLPIKQFMKPLSQTPGSLDLPLDQVVKMLLAVHSGEGWLNAFAQHLPKRKLWGPQTPEGET